MAMNELNEENVRCMCSGCYYTDRCRFMGATEDKEAACTFCPWFDKVLLERGFVVLRKYEWKKEDCDGLYADEHNGFTRGLRSFLFSNDDCHFVEKPSNLNSLYYDPAVRWGEIWIGKRLWNVESIDNQCIKQFKRVFGSFGKRISSPPTPPPEPA